MRRFFLFLIVIFSNWGCKDEYNICNEPKDVRFIANFYQKIGSVEQLTTAPNLNVSSIPGNAFIYTNQPNINSFSIPLNVGVDSAKYIISLSSALPQDTLTIVYTTQGGQNVSPNCPPLFLHNITRLYSTKNTIDSVKIINPVLNTSLSQNAKIYF